MYVVWIVFNLILNRNIEFCKIGLMFIIRTFQISINSDIVIFYVNVNNLNIILGTQTLHSIKVTAIPIACALNALLLIPRSQGKAMQGHLIILIYF